MKAWLLDMLECPVCQGGRLTLSDAEYRGGEVRAGRLSCGSHHTFRIDEGVPDFVGDEPQVREGSEMYDDLWNAHVRQQYEGREAEYRAKFQAHARWPQALDQYINGKTVLDAGCGEGRFTYLSSALGAERVVGADYSHGALQRAIRGTGNPPNCTFIRADLRRLPFGRPFDYVFSFGVLHHTPDARETFRGLMRHLKDDGHVSVYVYGPRTIPLIAWPLRAVTRRLSRARVLRVCESLGLGYDRSSRPAIPLGGLFRRLGRFDLLGIGGVTFESLTTPYLSEHSVDELKDWFAEAGLEVISTQPTVSASGRRTRASRTTD